MIESFSGHWTGETENAWNWYQNDKLDQWVRMRCSLPLHSLVTSITTSGLGMFFFKMLFKTTRKKTFKMVHQKISNSANHLLLIFKIFGTTHTPHKNCYKLVKGLQRVLVKISSVVQYHINFNFHLLFWKGGLWKNSLTVSFPLSPCQMS